MSNIDLGVLLQVVKIAKISKKIKYGEMFLGFDYNTSSDKSLGTCFQLEICKIILTRLSFRLK